MAQHTEMTVSELGSLVHVARYADHLHEKPRNLFSTFSMSPDSKSCDMYNQSSPNVNGGSQPLYYRAEVGTIQQSVCHSANPHVPTNCNHRCQHASYSLDNEFVGDDGDHFADMTRSFLPKTGWKPSWRKSETPLLFRAPSLPKLRFPSIIDKK
mmetsp:Transcript_20928/g.36017  ORF Transcript_20928/g.36017 Transcript_20928/m.36017 type:complete len:154 (-) Transcript_20928:72-533(-)